MAVGAPALADARYLRAVLAIAVRGLSHAYRDQPAAVGETVVVEASGAAGGTWTLVREADRWALQAGAPAHATARLRLSDDALWKLLHNALDRKAAEGTIEVEGRPDLAGPLIAARSVIV